MTTTRNVLNTPIQVCALEPRTGFYRDGCCQTGADDPGLHLVCAEMSDEFLQVSLDRGNDLITPVEEWGFPGLTAGDRWCICVQRWKEALEAGVAPKVCLEATHISTIEFVDLADLKRHAIDVPRQP